MIISKKSMYPFSSVNTAKSPWNARLAPAQACFPFESPTRGAVIRTNRTVSWIKVGTQHPDPLHTISIHLIRRQAEESGNSDGSAYVEGACAN